MYAKLFASLYQGTLRGRSHEILVFTNLLAHCDRHGFVDKHFRAIAEEVGLTREQVESAIQNLEAPDFESRSKELDGARLERIDEHRAWGWRVVNYAKYRAIRDEAERLEQNRVAQAKFRANRSKQSKPASASVSTSKPRKPMSAHADGEAEGDVEAEASSPSDQSTPHVSCNMSSCGAENGGQAPSPNGSESDFGDGGQSQDPPEGDSPRKQAVAARRDAAKRLLDILNREAGRVYRPVDTTLDPIVHRLEEVGDDEDGVATMIRRQVKAWGTDDKMAPFLRPATLFRKSKFHTYYDDRNLPPPNGRNGCTNRLATEADGNLSDWERGIANSEQGWEGKGF